MSRRKSHLSLLCLYHLYGDADRLQHTLFAGEALAGDVEGGAMVHRDAQNRQADGDVYAGIKTVQFDRNMALIVIHGDDQVVVAPEGAGKDSVWRMRPTGLKPLRL